MKAQSTVSSAVKVISTLQLLCEASGPMLLSEVRDALGVSEATAYRALQTLVTTGFVRSLAEGGYEPTLEVVRLGALVVQRDPLNPAVERAFRRVSQEYQEPVTVAVLDGDHALFVKKLSGPRDPNFTCDVGVRLPLYLGAAPRCLMAYLGDPEFEAYLATLPPGQTAPSVEQLREARAQTRALGHTFSQDEVDVGISAIGVPVLNQHGEILAAAAIANVTARWSEDDVTARTTAMRESAFEASEALVHLRSGAARG